MPEKKTIERAKKDKQEGKAASTQAGEFVREEMHHVREGKHGARNPKQAIAIGLSKARRSGVDLKPPKGKGKKKAEQDLKKGHSAKSTAKTKTSAKRSKATTEALKREPRSSASHSALSRHARQAAKSRGKTTAEKTTAKAAAKTTRKASPRKKSTAK